METASTWPDGRACAAHCCHICWRRVCSATSTGSPAIRSSDRIANFIAGNIRNGEFSQYKLDTRQSKEELSPQHRANAVWTTEVRDIGQGNPRLCFQATLDVSQKRMSARNRIPAPNSRCSPRFTTSRGDDGHKFDIHSVRV